MRKRRPRRIWWRRFFGRGRSTGRGWAPGRGRSNRPGRPSRWGRRSGGWRPRRHSRTFGRGRPFSRHGRRPHGFTLGDLSPGARARIVALEDIPRHARAKLLALGLVPGRRVEVIRQKPVTLVRAEHSELALEDELAYGITVNPEETSSKD